MDQPPVWTQSTYRGRVEIGRVCHALSAGAYTTTLYVMVDIVNGGIGVDTGHPHPHQANFSIMMEC